MDTRNIFVFIRHSTHFYFFIFFLIFFSFFFFLFFLVFFVFIYFCFFRCYYVLYYCCCCFVNALNTRYLSFNRNRCIYFPFVSRAKIPIIKPCSEFFNRHTKIKFRLWQNMKRIYKKKKNSQYLH